MLLLFQEVDVSRRDDAYKAATHLSVISDGNAAEAVTCFCLKDVSHVLLGAHHYRICNETLLVSLRDAAGWKGRMWNWGNACMMKGTEQQGITKAQY